MSTIPLRKDVLSLSAEEKEDLYRAFQKIQEPTTPGGQSEFFRIANYHGGPYRADNQPEKPDGFCYHANVLFLSWHRAYLLELENALRVHIPAERQKAFALPFWDATGSAALTTGLPEIFTQLEVTIDGRLVPNPLRKYSIPQQLQWGSLVIPAHTSTDRGYTWVRESERERVRQEILIYGIRRAVRQAVTHCLETNDYFLFSNTASAAAAGFNLNSSIEQPHNTLHVLLGGQWSVPAAFFSETRIDFDSIFENPLPTTTADLLASPLVRSLNLSQQQMRHLSRWDLFDSSTRKAEWLRLHNSSLPIQDSAMSAVECAAFDPIFYFHHANIDRLYWLWQKLHGHEDWTAPSNAGPEFADTNAPGQVVSMDTVLAPFDTAMTARRLSNTALISHHPYSYDLIRSVDRPAASRASTSSSSSSSSSSAASTSGGQLLSTERFSLAESTRPVYPVVKVDVDRASLLTSSVKCVSVLLFKESKKSDGPLISLLDSVTAFIRLRQDHCSNCLKHPKLPFDLLMTSELSIDDSLFIEVSAAYEDASERLEIRHSQRSEAKTKCCTIDRRYKQVREKQHLVASRRPAMRAVAAAQKNWDRGQTVTISLFEPNAREEQLVRQGVYQWQNILGTGLRLNIVEMNSDADIRVAFVSGDGHWSAVGKDSLLRNETAFPTNSMNLDPGSAESAPFGLPTVLHEFGHALGLLHEHQNPYRLIVWNEPAVIESFSKKPNEWSEEEVRFQILDKEPPSAVLVSESLKYDTSSIMHYEFEESWILIPETKHNFAVQFQDQATAKKMFDRLFQPNTIISKADKQLIQKLYPESLPASIDQ